MMHTICRQFLLLMVDFETLKEDACLSLAEGIMTFRRPTTTSTTDSQPIEETNVGIQGTLHNHAQWQISIGHELASLQQQQQ